MTGSTITVSSGKVTSGTVKGQSIAAFSNKTRSGKVSTAEAYPNKGTIPGESKTITLRSYQSTNTTYSTSDGQSGSFKDGDTIEIGSKAKSDEVVTVTVKGTGADGETIKHTYSYTKYGDPTYDPSDGTSSPCDKYCMEYMEKNGLDPDCYIDAKEPCHPRNVTVTAIKVSGDTSMDLASTQSVQLKADVTTDPAGKRPSVTWTSSDTSVATVDSKGKVSGLKAGTVKITATAGTNKKSDSITITITGMKPEVSNVIYATKPSGWSKIYAYVYNDTTSKNNGNWPGVEMTQLTADDSCAKAGTYKYEVPDLGEGKYRVIFTNGSGAQTPGASQPGIEFSGKVSWDGSSAAVSAVNCNTPQPVPVSSVSISGSGVSNGKLSLKSGASVQLTATVTPSNATDKTVSWTSSNSSVAKVSDGKITAVKGGTATITATAGGRTASVVVTVADNPVPVTSVSISGDGVSGGKLSLKSGASAQLTATVKPDDATDRKVTWTSSDSSVANVMGTGVVTAGSKAGKATVTATAGGVSASVEVTVEAVGKHPMTVWYHPDASWTTVKANWRLESDPKTLGRNVDMDKVKDGWYRLTIPDTKGSRVAVTFTDMKRLDNNANRNYVASGSVMTVKDGVLTLKAPDLESKQPMTVWYHPDASWTTVKANWRLESDPKTLGRNVDMDKVKDGWYRLTIPDTKGSRVAVTFTDMKRLDNNANRNYVVSGGSMAVSGGQVIGDVTPNCAITNKQ